MADVKRKSDAKLNEKKNQPAPQRISIIRCNCKTECDNKRCTCKKHGPDCNFSGGKCREQSCTNCGFEPMENEEADG